MLRVMRKQLRRTTLFLLTTWALVFAAEAAAQPVDEARTIESVRAAEAARSESREARTLLGEATLHKSARVRARAVRALGRWEQPEFITLIAESLRDSSPDVRTTAAWAVAQSMGRSGTAADGRTAFDALQSLLGRETSAAVRGAAYESLGRLASETTHEALWPSLAKALESPEETERVGAARGVETLARRFAKGPWPDEARDVIARCALSASVAVRRLCWEALSRLPNTRADFAAGLSDSDPQVRRLAVAAMASADATQRDGTPIFTEDCFRRALKDSSFRVGVEALRKASARIPSALIAGALNARNVPIRMAAAESLRARCSTPNADVARLLGDGRFRSRDPRERDLWALRRAIAACDPTLAGPWIQAPHSDWVVAVQQVAIAESARDIAALRRLATHAQPNVVASAIESLARTAKAESIDIVRNALFSKAPQVAREGALAFKGITAAADARETLVRALRAASNPHKDTWRDVRLAILDALESMGPSDPAALQEFLEMKDRNAAARVVRIMTAWGAPEVTLPAKAPVELPALAPPPMKAQRIRVEMRDGGSFDVELFPEVAPTTCARFLDLVSRQVYDGLTFHRYVANFVIQGGSPDANEYSGHDPYLMDEVGGRHVRGSVGISTRGRDTGDSQIYVSLVDLPRLDSDYTVFARVVRGMEDVDKILEGDVIRRIRVIP